MPINAFLCAELVAAAALALWVIARFPKAGPKSLRAAVLVVACGIGLVELAPVGVDLAVRLPHGAYAALFGVALPCLFGGFLAVGWSMRLLADALGGSGGGGGHRVPSRGRG
jgi:uncharacterized membrane protein YeiH